MMLLPTTLPDLARVAQAAAAVAAAAVAAGGTQKQEKNKHAMYLTGFRTQQCLMFLEHKCQHHRPYTCFDWHFPNQKRRRPIKKLDGTFNYNPDVYCTKYDENSGICPNGEECPYVHRNAGDTERRYHPRYFKTGNCIYETTEIGACVKNGQHCAFAHGTEDIRLPVYDIREVQDAAQHSINLPASLEKERVLSEDPQWNDMQHVLAFYKTEQCKKPPRMCRQGYACPFFHNGKDKRRNPKVQPYRSTPCPQVKPGDEWRDSVQCDSGDNCTYCHTRTEQQFHPEIYKSTKCNDVVHNGYCPRGPFCAFAHVDSEMNIGKEFMAGIEFPILTSEDVSNNCANTFTSATTASSTDCSSIWNRPASCFDSLSTSNTQDISSEVSSCLDEDNDCTFPFLSPLITTPSNVSTKYPGLIGLTMSSLWSSPSSGIPITAGNTANCHTTSSNYTNKKRQFSGGSLSSESGLSSSSARGDTPPYSYGLDATLSNWSRNVRSQMPLKQIFSSGFTTSAQRDWMNEESHRVESIVGNALGDSYNIQQRDLCELERWPDEHSFGGLSSPDYECGTTFSSDCKSLSNTLRSAPVSIPRGQTEADRNSNVDGSYCSSGLGSFSFTATTSGSGSTIEQASVNSTGFVPNSAATAKHAINADNSSPRNFTNLSSPILSNSPFSNATNDLERLSLQKELDEYRSQLRSKKDELESTKKERDMVMYQLQESMHVIRSLVHHLGQNQSPPATTNSNQSNCSSESSMPSNKLMLTVLIDALQKSNVSDSNALLENLNKETSEKLSPQITLSSGSTTPVSSGQ